MSPKEKPIERMYWSIGEVATLLGVKTSLLRYWEKEFGTLRPKRTNKGDRLYTKADIEQLQRIQYLVKEKGYTLQGAKGQLRKRAVPETPPPAEISLDEVRNKLLRVRQKLVELGEQGW